MYLQGEKLMISVENIPELIALIDNAKKEAEQLNQTLNQLSHFDLSIHFSVGSSNETGGVETVSSANGTALVQEETDKGEIT